MPYGYPGKILHVDLTTRSVEVAAPPETRYRTYVGGSALGLNYLLRTFNAREGITRERDTLPKRLFEPLEGGPTDGRFVDRAEFEAALETYYGMAGWDPISGNPTAETLDKLEPGWLREELGL